MLLKQILCTYFQDPSLDEVLLDASDLVVLISGQSSHCVSSLFLTQSDLFSACQELAWSQNLRLDPLCPAAGGSLELQINAQLIQFRWHCLLPPVARDGPLLSVRRHRLQCLSLEDFVSSDLRFCLLDLASFAGPLFIIGPTGAGKTSLMTILLRLQAASKRTAILEQIAELPRLEPSWIRLEARSADLEGRGAFTLSQAFDELLRLRPDRIVIGELRQKEEAKAIRRAILSGHGSVWSTLHASGPLELADRLAELSGHEAESWTRLLIAQEAGVVVMGREFPRVRELWLWGKEGPKPFRVETC